MPGECSIERCDEVVGRRKGEFPRLVKGIVPRDMVIKASYERLVLFDQKNQHVEASMCGEGVLAVCPPWLVPINHEQGWLGP